MPVDERRELHAAFADDLEAELSPHSDAPVEAVVALADHRYEAAQLDEALAWAVRAADSTRTAGGQSEMLRLLSRALHLEELMERSPVSRRELLERLVSAADIAGDNAEELGAINLLLDEVEPAREPLRVAELLVRRAHLRFSTGASFSDVAEFREAVALAAQSPDSWQYAYALACLAWGEYWNASSRRRARGSGCRGRVPRRRRSRHVLCDVFEGPRGVRRGERRSVRRTRGAERRGGT